MNLTENKKYESLLRTARELFWKYGIRRVTIEEICRTAEVSKMTFYKHFDNKTDLVKKLLDRIFSESMDGYRSIMDSDAEFHEKVRKMVLLKIEGTYDLSKEFLQDFYSKNDIELTSFLQTRTNEIITTIKEDFAEAIRKGDIRSDIKPDFIFYFLNHIIEMASDPELLKLYDSAQEMILEMTNIFFYGILPTKREQK